MTLDRRHFLIRSGLALAAVGLLPELVEEESAVGEAAAPPSWSAVRAQFPLTRDYLHFAGLLLTSHPAPVRKAIDAHRRALDRNPVHYLHDQNARREGATLAAAAAYLGVGATDIALTDSTTMGLGLLYNGLQLHPGDEVLTTRHDFRATHEALSLKAARSGARVRIVSLYAQPATASVDEIVSAVVRALTPRTRAVALTWVHSSTGVKLPLRAIAAALGEAGADRGDAGRILLCVDGVHGLGVEDVTLTGLGCDFFVAGCHKWLFGPRGTGLVWGHPRAWPSVAPTIPTFSGGTPAGELTPGGFKPFEHRWALAEAFRFHRSLGKPRVAARIHVLNRRLKAGLAAMSHVRLYTPRSEALSAGLVCFDVDRLSPGAVVEALRRRRIIASVTPYATSYARLAPGLVNSPAEVDRVVAAIRSLR